MADRPISDLSEALQIYSSDWFVLEQNGVAKKLSGEALKQYISMVEIKSIDRVYFDSTNRCHIILTDGTEIISESLKGADGRDGVDGEDGSDAPTITNIVIDASYHLIITLSNGTSYDAGYCRGASGAGTGDMLAEDYDPNGEVATAGGIPAFVSQYGGGMKLVRRTSRYEAVRGGTQTVQLTSASSSTGGSTTFQYASSVSVNQATQAISLVNPSTTQSVNYNNYTRANDLNGNYFKTSNGNFYYGVANPTRAHPTLQPYTVSISAQLVTVQLIHTEWEPVDPSEDPLEGYEYAIRQENGDITELTADVLSEYFDFLSTNGGNMNGSIDMNGYAIQNVPDPINDGDASNKKYVDNAVSGISSEAIYEATYEIQNVSGARNISIFIEDYVEIEGKKNILKLSLTGITVENKSTTTITISNGQETFSHSVNYGRYNSAIGVFAPGNTVVVSLSDGYWNVIENGLPNYTNIKQTSVKTIGLFYKEFGFDSDSILGETSMEAWDIDEGYTYLYPKGAIQTQTEETAPVCLISRDRVRFQPCQTQLPRKGCSASNPVLVNGVLYMMRMEAAETEDYYNLYCMKSLDYGQTWVVGSLINTGNYWPTGTLCYNGTRFLFADSNYFFTSTDGNTWSKYNIPVSGYDCLSEANGFFCISDPDNSQHYIYYSETGLENSWSSINMGTSLYWTGVFGVKENGSETYHFVAFGCSDKTTSATTYAAHSTYPPSGWTLENLGSYGYSHYCRGDTASPPTIAYCFAGGRYYISLAWLSSGLHIYTKDVTGSSEYSKTSPNTTRPGFTLDSSFMIYQGKVGGTSGLVIVYNKPYITYEQNMPNGMPILSDKVFSGKYEGTGTYGSDNKHTLTFPFRPRIVIIENTGSQTRPYVAVLIVDSDTANVDMNGTNVSVWDLTWSSATAVTHTVKWYARAGTRSEAAEMNQIFNEYHYVAIG